MSPADEPWPDRVRAAFVEAVGEQTDVEEGFGPVTVDMPGDAWHDAAALARDELGCTFFDWLSAVDEADEGFRLVCHLARHRPGRVEHLLVRTLLPRESPTATSIADVYPGARWHERETHEMFGVDFTQDGHVLELAPLLLPEEFEGHPLRKEFVLASRVVKPWPGAKEPGESGEAAPSRRRTRPPGVPEPEEWGPHPPGGADG